MHTFIFLVHKQVLADHIHAKPTFKYKTRGISFLGQDS
jgi:hypothetical protein